MTYKTQPGTISGSMYALLKRGGVIPTGDRVQGSWLACQAPIGSVCFAKGIIPMIFGSLSPAWQWGWRGRKNRPGTCRYR